MAKILDPFAGAREGIQMERGVNRSQNVVGGTVSVNRGDLGSQVEELKRNYLVGAGYEEDTSVSSKEKLLLEKLKSQYGDLDNIENLLLNSPENKNPKELQLITNIRQTSIVDNRSDEDKLLDEMLAEL